MASLSSVASANEEISVIRFLLQHEAELFDQQSLDADDQLSITSTDTGNTQPTQQVPFVVT